MLYLQDDDAIDEIDDEVVAALNNANKVNMKAPKNYMLSEISEEDDVSMPSERKELVTTKLKSIKSSRVQSHRKINTLASNDIQNDAKVLQSNDKIQNKHRESLGQLMSKTLNNDNK